MGSRKSLLPDVPHSSDSSEEDIDIEENSRGTLDSDEETSEAAMEVRPAASASKQSSVSKKKDQASASHSQSAKAVASKQSSVSKKKDQASASHSQPAKAVASKPAKKKLAATPEKPSPAKRPREAEDSKHAKKNKKKKEKKKNSEAVDGGMKNPEEEVPKTARGGESKKLFERLWSEENEIAILKGIIEYAVKNNIQPEKVEIGKLMDSIKEPLGFEFTKKQLQDKARRLKSRYQNKVANKKYPKTGYELELFNLSAEIWGQCPDGASRLGSKSPTKGEALISLENGWDGRLFDDSKVRTKKYMERALRILDSFSDSDPKKARFQEELKKIEEADRDLLLMESELMSKKLKFSIEILSCRR